MTITEPVQPGTPQGRSILTVSAQVWSVNQG
jgi:hypothetical protein